MAEATMRQANRVLTLADMGWAAPNALLARFGQLEKVVIFTDWEQDWVISGRGCRGLDEAGLPL
jgi:hypothetical protein